jgi:adenine-specific DNA-methyltransferase
MPEPVRFCPDNPHPLSQIRTELVWEGKYDEYGRRRSVDVAGASMPMQKIETVDMPRSEALAGGQTTLGELSTTVRQDILQRPTFALIWAASDSILINLS